MSKSPTTQIKMQHANVEHILKEENEADQAMESVIKDGKYKDMSATDILNSMIASDVNSRPKED